MRKIEDIGRIKQKTFLCPRCKTKYVVRVRKSIRGESAYFSPRPHLIRRDGRIDCANCQTIFLPEIPSWYE